MCTSVEICCDSCRSTSGDLLGKICKSLNDLQQKSNVIKRDGSIIPISKHILEISGDY